MEGCRPIPSTSMASVVDKDCTTMQTPYLATSAQNMNETVIVELNLSQSVVPEHIFVFLVVSLL